MFDKIRDWKNKLVEDRAKKKRVESILKSCGCVCKCPKCEEPLNDNSECEEIGDDGIYKYTCAKCEFKSVFHFAIAPVPIYLEDFKEAVQDIIR